MFLTSACSRTPIYDSGYCKTGCAMWEGGEVIVRYLKLDLVSLY